MRQTLILLTGLFALVFSNAETANAQSTQEEYGKCGYYADALHGRKTASGELYDKEKLTCAHKTLPFGTSVRVTRMDNKKSVVVRVNDRGPFIDGYVVDISRKAAESIGLIRDGVTKVKVEVIGKEAAPAAAAAPTVVPATYSTDKSPATVPAVTTARSVSASEAKAQLIRSSDSKAPVPAVYSAPTTAKAAPASVAAAPKTESPATAVSELFQIEIKPVRGKGYGLQLAVLTSTENLFQEVEKLQATWPGKVIVSHEEAGGNALFRLILGPYNSRKDAEAQQRKAAGKGFKKAFAVEFE